MFSAVQSHIIAPHGERQSHRVIHRVVIQVHTCYAFYENRVLLTCFLMHTLLPVTLTHVSLTCRGTRAAPEHGEATDLWKTAATGMTAPAGLFSSTGVVHSIYMLLKLDCQVLSCSGCDIQLHAIPS